MSGSAERPYHIDWSTALARHWKRLQRRAAREGRSARFAASVKSITELLQSEPLMFGEALGHLPHLDLQVRIGAVAPLIVVYAVDVERRIVYLRSFELLSL